MPEQQQPAPESAAEPARPEEPAQGGAASPSAPDALARMRGALLRPSRGQISVAVLLGVLMFAAVTQLRLYGDDNPYSGLRQSDLVQALNGLSAAEARAEAEINQLERVRNSLRDRTRQRAAALEQAQQQLTTLGILAGTIPATGPGIVIVVNDPKRQYRVNHLLDGIEELRDAGAEAIQINGTVRVVAQTSFEDAENGIAVDGRVLSPPYTLEVIGDPDTLSKALEFPGGFKDDVALDEGTTEVRRKESLTVDVVRPAPRSEFATTQPDG